MTDMMKKLELDELNEKIEKLEADLALWDGRKDKRIDKLREYLDTCEAAYERGMAEKDAEIERLKLEILNGR